MRELIFKRGVPPRFRIFGIDANIMTRFRRELMNIYSLKNDYPVQLHPVLTDKLSSRGLNLVRESDDRLPLATLRYAVVVVLRGGG